MYEEGIRHPKCSDCSHGWTGGWGVPVGEVEVAGVDPVPLHCVGTLETVVTHHHLQATSQPLNAHSFKVNSSQIKKWNS